MRTFLTKTQWYYIKKWILMLLVVEVLMCFFNGGLPVMYLAISFLFFGGFILRLLNIYPGKYEPVALDAAGGAFAFVMAVLAWRFSSSNLRFFLIFTSSVIILPHIAYIISNPKIK